MISLLLYELKIGGKAATILAVGIVTAMTLICVYSGYRLNASLLCYEVLYPCFTTIFIGINIKVRTDALYDLAYAQTKSIFQWLLIRFFALLLPICLVGALGGVIALYIRQETNSLLFLRMTPTVLFFASMTVLLGCLTKHEFFPLALSCSIFFAFMMASKAIGTYTIMRFIYPFLCFYSPEMDWRTNKAILVILSILIWMAVYIIIKNRKLPE